ncbi:MAG: DRTGG domain-containing protein [Oscillospiraceae bacterium]|nr:DRTGG domain-containing protein [Oscillospiraceae bacterium]MCL2279194.1 DRTGG domain-containing protein [Oscillospiraceae bacterium]
MTVNELEKSLTLKKLSEGENREITSCYISDMLSRVMGGLNAGDVWITVQTSLNMVAVATLAEASCIILPEKLTASQEVTDRATEENITIFSADEDAYALAKKISKLLQD